MFQTRAMATVLHVHVLADTAVHHQEDEQGPRSRLQALLQSYRGATVWNDRWRHTYISTGKSKPPIFIGYSVKFVWHLIGQFLRRNFYFCGRTTVWSQRIILTSFEIFTGKKIYFGRKNYFWGQRTNLMLETSLLWQKYNFLAETRSLWYHGIVVVAVSFKSVIWTTSSTLTENRTNSGHSSIKCHIQSSTVYINLSCSVQIKISFPVVIGNLDVLCGCSFQVSYVFITSDISRLVHGQAPVFVWRSESKFTTYGTGHNIDNLDKKRSKKYWFMLHG